METEKLSLYDRYREGNERPRVLIVEPASITLQQALPSDEFELEYRPDAFQNIGDILERIRASAVNYLIVRGATQVKGDDAARLFHETANFVGVGRYGIGVDNIDVTAATQHGVLVQNAPTATVESVGEHAFALALALLKRVGPNTVAGASGRWEKKETKELRGKKVLIIAAGKIGTDAAAKFDAFGCEVSAYDPFVESPLFVFGRSPRGLMGKFAGRRSLSALAGERSMRVTKHKDEFFRLLRDADIISLHTPGGQNKPVLGAEELAVMKKGVLVVNTGRKEALDYAALMDAVEKSDVSVALDVLPKEKAGFAEYPIVARLLELQRAGKNVVVTHHTAGNTTEGQDRVGTELGFNLRELFKQGNIVNTVNTPETIRPRNADSPRLIIFNRDRAGATAKVTSVLADAGLNVHTIPFEVLPGIMRAEKLDVLGFEVDANGDSPRTTAEKVRTALERVCHDESGARELFIKALIL